MRKFTCAHCGERYPISRLSSQSLDDAGTTRPAEAVRVLSCDQLICAHCAPKRKRQGSDVAFYQDRYPHMVRLDRVTLDWLRQNY